MSESRQIAEHQLEIALKDVLSDEFEACWNGLKSDPAVSDPAEQMEELAEWFSEQVQALITELMEQEPDEDDDSFFEDEDDDEADEDEDEDAPDEDE